jgi:hypothetical protein
MFQKMFLPPFFNGFVLVPPIDGSSVDRVGFHVRRLDEGVVLLVHWE